MAYFVESNERLIQAALRERRLIMLVAPRRSGLTFWCQRAFGGMAASEGWAKYIDLARHADVPKIKQEISRYFEVSPAFEDAKHLLGTQTEGARGRRQSLLLVFLNAHRCARSVLVWLVRFLVEYAEVSDTDGTGFVVEGSVDADSLLAEAFPDGPPSMPLVQYAEPPAPWQALIETEELRRVRFQRHSELLSPWIADLTGGDIRLSSELFEKLPAGTHLTQEQIEQALMSVVGRGATGAEIVRAAQSISGSDILLRLVCGHFVHTAPPPHFPSQSVQELFLAGIAAYDPVIAGYRLRSACIARMLADRLAVIGKDILPMRDLISARTTVLLAYVGAVELQLRALLATSELERLAGDVSTSTEFGKVGADLRRKLAGLEGLQSRMGEIARVCSEVLPEKQTVLSAAIGRADDEATARSSLSDYVTLSELSALAKQAKLIEDEDAETVRRVNRARNALAHFRGVNFSGAREVVDAVHELLRRMSNVIKKK